MNDTSISVSIIVPNYNYACYLNVRIASILNQSYTNYELILLDDASTDNSVEILEKYKDNPHVSHILVNEKNSGSPFSNQSLSECCALYDCFLVHRREWPYFAG